MNQIIAIIYTFAVVYAEESWWKMAVIVECVEVGIVLFFAPIQEISTPIELAYMTPLTSQALAIIVIYLASRRSFPNKAPRHTADHLLSAGLFVIIAFAAVLGLSLAGFLPRLLVIQWFIFVSVLTVGYRLPERLDRPHELDGLESDTQLTRRLRSRWFGRDSPRRESYRSLSGAEPLPPPDAHLPR